MFSFGTGVDLTDYSGATEAPELGLKALFQSEKIPVLLRQALAKKGLTTMKKFAMLGSTMEVYETKIKNILGSDLGADAGEIDLNVTMLGVIWLSCSRTLEYEMNQRVRLQEDPTKVPEIGVFDHADMRERWWTAHPDIVLQDDNEPHKKFVEKVNRDITVHGVMMFYELTEVRVKKDKVVKAAGFSKTLDGIVKVTQQDDELAPVESDREVMHRIEAFLITCEWLGVNEYRSASFNEGDEDGCGLSYWQKIIEQRVEFQKYTGKSPMLFTVLADRKFRKKVAELQYTKRGKFKTFKDAMSHVLQNFRYYWTDARSEALAERPDASWPQEVVTPTKSNKRELDEETPVKEKAAVEALKILSEKKHARNAKKRQKLRAKAAGSAGGGSSNSGGANAQGSGGTSQGQGGSSGRDPLPRRKGSGKGGKSDRVPADLFAKIKQMAQQKKKCVFYNVGRCSYGASCKEEHGCAQCGGDHAYIDRH